MRHPKKWHGQGAKGIASAEISLKIVWNIPLHNEHIDRTTIPKMNKFHKFPLNSVFHRTIGLKFRKFHRLQLPTWPTNCFLGNSRLLVFEMLKTISTWRLHFCSLSGQVVELNGRNQVGAGSCFTPPQKRKKKNYTPENERIVPKKGTISIGNASEPTIIFQGKKSSNFKAVDFCRQQHTAVPSMTE